MKLHRDLGVNQHTAWIMLHRIPKAFAPIIEATLEGSIEIDKTHIGGKDGNKHGHKKRKAGRGTVGKMAVAGIRDHETNESV